MVIISLIGFAGSGKDTFGKYLIDNFGFIKLSFASSLKDCVSSIFGWNRDLLEGLTDESRIWRETIDPFWNITPRQALVQIGTNLFRKHFDKDIWVKSLIKQIQNLPQKSNIVITDCRFKNEIDSLKNIGAISIFIDSFERINIKDLNDSEKELMEIYNNKDLDKNYFDYIIYNNKSINDFHDQIKICLNNLKI